MTPATVTTSSPAAMSCVAVKCRTSSWFRSKTRTRRAPSQTLQLRSGFFLYRHRGQHTSPKRRTAWLKDCGFQKPAPGGVGTEDVAGGVRFALGRQGCGFTLRPPVEEHLDRLILQADVTYLL